MFFQRFFWLFRFQFNSIYHLYMECEVKYFNCKYHENIVANARGNSIFFLAFVVKN